MAPHHVVEEHAESKDNSLVRVAVLNAPLGLADSGCRHVPRNTVAHVTVFLIDLAPAFGQHSTSELLEPHLKPEKLGCSGRPSVVLIHIQLQTP